MTSLFDQNDDTPQLDQSKNYLAELVGEGKKFKTNEELARGKAEADLYIQTVNKRADQLRDDYLQLREQLNARDSEETAQAKFEELLARYEVNRTPPQLPVETPERKPTPFDPSKLDSLIEEKLLKTEANRKAQTNFTEVQKKLKEQLGSNYQSILQDKMNELDLTTEDINALARKSPTAFFNTLQLNQQTENILGAPRSNQRSGFNPKTPERRTWSYYENLRKANPKIYYDPKIANQMHDDALALGTEFQDGDFHA